MHPRLALAECQQAEDVNEAVGGVVQGVRHQRIRIGEKPADPESRHQTDIEAEHDPQCAALLMRVCIGIFSHAVRSRTESRAIASLHMPHQASGASGTTLAIPGKYP
jgi:hypothetical protein